MMLKKQSKLKPSIATLSGHSLQEQRMRWEHSRVLEPPKLVNGSWTSQSSRTGWHQNQKTSTFCGFPATTEEGNPPWLSTSLRSSQASSPLITPTLAPTSSATQRIRGETPYREFYEDCSLSSFRTIPISSATGSAEDMFTAAPVCLRSQKRYGIY